MNRFSFLLITAVSMLASAGASAQYADWPAKDVFPKDQERYGHLEYFGFYASAMGSWNFTEELAPFTNLTWIHVGSPDDQAGAIEQFIERLDQARNAGVQAALSIAPFLFNPGVGTLRNDAEIEDFLVELRAQLEFEDLIGTVAMMYPKDEPFRELIRERKPNFIDEYITGKAYREIHADLVHVNVLIKLVFPEKPIGVILSGYRLHHDFFSIPENYDWVGFDCYQDLFRSCDDRSFTRHYAHLLKFMQPHQRLMAVPETWAMNEAMNRPDWPDVLTRRLRHHYEIALNEPRFVALVPFIWSFDADVETPGLGLDRFPELYDDGIAFTDRVVETGLEIKLGQETFPNMAYEETENSIYRPAHRIRGGIMSVNGQGLISAWAVDDALPHKNLRVQILVRNSRGELIHKSRTERTFIRDVSLAESLQSDDLLVGLHGYRYQLPPTVTGRDRWQQLKIELVVYADGAAREAAAVDSQWFDAGLRPPRPILDRDPSPSRVRAE